MDVDDAAASSDDIELLTNLGQLLIEAVYREDPVEKITSLIEAGAPLWYQTEDEGLSALHAAAYKENYTLAKLLLDNGAVWNAVDNQKITAGEVALSLNNEKIYTLIRDAGIRSEMLLALLSKKSSALPASSLVLRASDTSATGSTDVFLSSKLRYTADAHGQEICLLQADGDEVGVMMGWERDLMKATVSSLCDSHPDAGRGLKVLNIGFGLGIIDSLFQQLPVKPSQHVIIEPHPDVISHMKQSGWESRPGVHILEGKWQDFVDTEKLLSFGGFDVIYTDTFSEDYGELRKFFEALPDLMAGPTSRFSFFHGLGATNALFYDVYTRLSELHLDEVGINVEWRDIDVTAESGATRWGETREYFSLPLYRLPVGMMKTF